MGSTLIENNLVDRLKLMAVLEVTNHTEMYLSESNEWNGYVGGKTAPLPRIFFDDGEPWLAANRYAAYLLTTTSGKNPKTITSKMNHLKAYASWLEENQIDWRNFPKKQKDRCLFQYRGFLIDTREKGLLAASTVTTRMGAVIQFYRYAQREFLLDPTAYLWNDNLKKLHFYTTVGLSRTLSVLSSELSIPNRKTKHACLEDGLLPITEKNRDLLIKFLFDNGQVELLLMCLIGFFTGARSETIRTIKISTLEKASNELTSDKIKILRIGPGTGVKTKNDVQGYLALPSFLFSTLQKYAHSTKRLIRQAKADSSQKDLLFLSFRGNMYSENTFTKLFSDLRNKLISSGHTQFKNFKFHQSRATYGTCLMRIALDKTGSQSNAIIFVKERMLHKSESTTWKYIKFIEDTKDEEEFAKQFFNLFTGNHVDSEIANLIDEITF